MALSKKIKFLPVYAISILPTPILLGISSLIAVFLYHVVRYRRGVVSQNLEKAFPDKSEQERKQIARKFYSHFCDVIFLTCKSLTITPKEIRRRFGVKNLELIDRLYKEKKSIILYSAHQGNWEWKIFLPLFLPHHCSSFYQRLSNPYFEDLMLLIRSRFGLVCLESAKGYRGLMGFAKNQIVNLNYIIGDQSPHRKRPKYWTTFLNQETAFLIGADRIARKTNQVVVFAFSRQLGRGKYEMEFQLMSEQPKDLPEGKLIEDYASKLEAVIRENPVIYLWSHRRWKLKREPVSTE